MFATWGPESYMTKGCVEDKRCTERRFTSFNKVEDVIIYMCIVVSISYKNITNENSLQEQNQHKNN
jgi:hypothetical protein